MKKFKKICAVSLLSIGIPLVLTQSIHATLSPVVNINNKKVSFESNLKPYINSKGYTLLPFRAMSDLLDLSIDWQSPYVIATGINQQTKQALRVKAKVGSMTISINNKSYAIESAVEMKDSRTYIPLRLFSEIFGYNVDWVNGEIFIEIPSGTNAPSQTPNQPTTPSVTPTQPSVPSSSPSSFEAGVAELVNRERAAQGLRPLTLDTKLSSVAREKSKDMRVNRYFSHTSPTYGSPFDMMKDFGITYKRAAENIAQGQTTPEAVMISWMNSPGHRANILDANLTHIGVGYDSQGHYWTQMFITP